MDAKEGSFEIKGRFLTAVGRRRWLGTRLRSGGGLDEKALNRQEGLAAPSAHPPRSPRTGWPGGHQDVVSRTPWPDFATHRGPRPIPSAANFVSHVPWCLKQLFSLRRLHFVALPAPQTKQDLTLKVHSGTTLQPLLSRRPSLALCARLNNWHPSIIRKAALLGAFHMPPRPLQHLHGHSFLLLFPPSAQVGSPSCVLVAC